MKAIMLVLFLLVSFLAGIIGSQFEPGLWYELLNKPAWTPPKRLFLPVWIVLYALMALAAWLVWQRENRLTGAHGLFFFQLALNAAWPWLFFGLHRTGWALGEILVLCVAVAATTAAFRRSHRLAAGLMLPYLAWISFAAALNYSLWRLNGGVWPF